MVRRWDLTALSSVRILDDVDVIGAGVRDRVAAFAGEVERLAASAPATVGGQPLARAASIYARLGEVGRAGSTVETAASVAMAEASPYFQVINLVFVAQAYARLGRIRDAERYTRRASDLVSVVEDPDWRGQAQAMVVGAMAWTGRQRRGERRARALADPGDRVTALLYIADACPAGAARLVDEAVPVARSITGCVQLVRMLTLLADAMARHRRYDEAWRLAEEAQTAVTDTEPRYHPVAYAEVAIAFAQADQTAVALSMARRADELAGNLGDEGWRQAVTPWVVEAYARTGGMDKAEQCARGLTDSFARACALSRLAIVLAPVNLDDSERIARTIDDEEWHMRMYTFLRSAEAVLNAADDPPRRTQTW